MRQERIPEIPGVDKIGVPSRGKVIGPTKAEAKAANAGEYAPTGAARLLAEVARKWKALVAAGLAVGGGVAAYETIPAVHQAVDSLFLERIGVNTKEIGPTFDNTKVKELISDNNAITLSISDIERQFPQIEKVGDTPQYAIKSIFPFILPEGTTVTLDKSPRTRGNPEGFNPPVKENPLFKFSKPGVKIIAPANANVILFTSDRGTGLDDPRTVEWAKIEYYDPDNDITVQWGITATLNGPHATSFKPLIEVQDFKQWHGEKGVAVERGRPIMETIDGNEEISINVNAWRGKTLKDPKDMTFPNYINPYIQFFTVSAKGEEKLVVPQEESFASGK